MELVGVGLLFADAVGCGLRVATGLVSQRIFPVQYEWGRLIPLFTFAAVQGFRFAVPAVEVVPF